MVVSEWWTGRRLARCMVECFWRRAGRTVSDFCIWCGYRRSRRRRHRGLETRSAVNRRDTSAANHHEIIARLRDFVSRGLHAINGLWATLAPSALFCTGDVRLGMSRVRRKDSHLDDVDWWRCKEWGRGPNSRGVAFADRAPTRLKSAGWIASRGPIGVVPVVWIATFSMVSSGRSVRPSIRWGAQVCRDCVNSAFVSPAA